LPDPFVSWFANRGWRPRAHQLELLADTASGRSMLLIAPTGAGKTLAGFLPSLTELAARGKPKPGAAGGRSLHTLYISPLKALAVDIERNLARPVEEMDLPVRIETRTGDTPQSKRARQRTNPPDILLTTPEQVSLLIANASRRAVVQGSALRHLRRIALADRLQTRSSAIAGAGAAQATGPGPAHDRPVGHRRRSGGVTTLAGCPIARAGQSCRADHGPGGASPIITILESEERIPWSGHSARYAIPDIYETIKAHRTALIFVNTRSQAELLFQELWRINDDSLPIALHHGSLDAAQRRRVEAAMGRNELRAVVATSTLDLGIDWGDVDLVIHVGAPKGASRLAQRIGRANHRMDEASRAILTPSNRFEVLECQAAIDANYVGAQDTPASMPGALDVLAQHVLGMAAAAPFDADDLYTEVTSAAPYRDIDRNRFGKVIDFVATGGYALKSYERYARIRKRADGLWRISNPQVVQQYRLNIGTIVEAPMLNVRMVSRKNGRTASRGGPPLGQVEEYFLESLTQGDTFLFSGKILRFEGIRENECLVSKAWDQDPKVPAYAGGKFPLSTYLAESVRAMIADPSVWHALPDQVSDWLRMQQQVSQLPARDSLLIETFPRSERFFMVLYPFEGRIAHQTLGMLLTRRLERTRARPLGFVASDYSLAIWGLEDMGAMISAGRLDLGQLFDEDMLGDDLDAWLDESWLLKRTFRACAVISGLIERRHPGKEKSGRQVTVSADLIYDVLRSHEPDHILLQATRADAASGLLDIHRLGAMLKRIKGHIRHRALERISPLAVPIMLEIGRERWSAKPTRPFWPKLPKTCWPRLEPAIEDD
jgi:ATP-dependent Lhr-like helicase